MAAGVGMQVLVWLLGIGTPFSCLPFQLFCICIYDIGRYHQDIFGVQFWHPVDKCSEIWKHQFLELASM